MPTLQNLPVTKSDKDKTTSYFNNLYTPSKAIATGKYDTIISYFQQRTGNIDTAKIMTQAVIDTAEAQRLDPLEVLNQFKVAPDDELSIVLALYLNSSRINTSLLGYKVTPPINQYTARNIIF